MIQLLPYLNHSLGVPKKLLYKIQVVMNKALRICYRSKREDSNYYNHLKAKVLPLHLRRKCSILKLMFSNVDSPENIVSQEGISGPRRSLRSSRFPKIACVFPNSETFRKSLSYTGPKYWEKLPGRLKTISDPKSFKNEVKTHFRDLFIETGFV